MKIDKNDGRPRYTEPPQRNTVARMTTVYDFTADTLAGAPMPLSDYAGEVLLIVNVASKCGLTPQYAGLETLYRKYRGRGFQVLGFPCNQFGGQEPGEAAEIASFCSLTYDVSFPLFAKIDVNGEHAHPLYAFLKAQKRASTAPSRPIRNLVKFHLMSDPSQPRFCAFRKA